jgi:hypothetical protein
MPLAAEQTQGLEQERGLFAMESSKLAVKRDFYP